MDRLVLAGCLGATDTYTQPGRDTERAYVWSQSPSSLGGQACQFFLPSSCGKGMILYVYVSKGLAVGEGEHDWASLQPGGHSERGGNLPASDVTH